MLQCRVGVTYGLKLRLYGGLLTMIWLRADTITKMRIGMTCTKRARPPCKEIKLSTLESFFAIFPRIRKTQWLDVSPCW